jgi:hypothetical protein
MRSSIWINGTPSRLTKNRFMAVGSLITGIFQSVVVEKQQTCRTSVLHQLLTVHCLNAKTPLESEEPLKSAASFATASASTYSRPIHCSLRRSLPIRAVRMVRTFSYETDRQQG